MGGWKKKEASDHPKADLGAEDIPSPIPPAAEPKIDSKKQKRDVKKEHAAHAKFDKFKKRGN